MRVLVLVRGPAALVPLAGVPPVERLLRQLERLGVAAASVIADDAPGAARRLAPLAWARPRLELEVRPWPAGCDEARAAAQALASGEEPALVLRGDTVLDSRLLAAMLRAPAPSALIDSAPPPERAAWLAAAPELDRARVVGAWVLRRSDLGAEGGTLDGQRPAGLALVDVAGEPHECPALRRGLRPSWFPAPGPEHRGEVEAVLVAECQKGAQDLPALVHAPIENALVRRLAATPVTANQLSLLTTLVALGATALLAGGRLGAGLGVALAVGVLDGLDGKLARLRVETSALGRIEHVADFLYENSWWTALAWHHAHAGGGAAAWQALATLFSAQVLEQSGRGLLWRRRKRVVETMAPFDLAVRRIGGRRNVYVWLLALGELAGWSWPAFLLLPWWAGVSALLVAGRAVWHARAGGDATTGAP